MTKNLIILFALLGLVGVYTLYIDETATPSTETTKQVATTAPGLAAPDFSFHDVSGKSHHLLDYRGHPVVLNFWASWCGPCIIEFPHMLKLASVQKNTTFLFLSLDDSKDDIDRFVKKYGKNLPQQNVIIGWDQDKSISQSLYQTFKLPETYLIDSKGILREKIIGADIDWTSEEMQLKLQGF